MRNILDWRSVRDFLGEDDGAVTVDWVVLTAAVVIAFFAAIVPISAQLDSLLGETATMVESVITIAKGW